MGMDKYSSVGSFEEMAEQNDAPEVSAEPSTEPVTTTEGVTEAEVTADNVETEVTE